MKTEWTEADFHELSWHDVHVYAVGAVPERFEVRLDLDFIVEWLAPGPGASALDFRVAPATLVFENAGELQVHLSSPTGVLTLQELRREDEQRLPGASMSTWRWTLVANEGSVALRASGFRQFLRQAPQWVRGRQHLLEEERGGPSLSALPAK
ncbi:hypothetical protein HPC49_09975 [Pyxidicoccus fallax]|uniref:Uncharacterized protein n=1 Tax=Pyxidicoccus fallax TaxID=394095 RepID=A0A848LII8_9BACT|nr:hypothetical protein [Pyxidicoccus fallax]NMO17537.1 hypothetical protein [Pyxidicoccus fallax]NPC78569.1 hypothetical protein [Pyxidicoccus fallax]